MHGILGGVTGQVNVQTGKNAVAIRYPEIFLSTDSVFNWRRAMTGAKASYQDIDVLLRLYDLRREALMREARRFVDGKFAPKSADELVAIVNAGTQDSGYVLQVYGYWDMVAAFVLDGPLNERLVYDTCQEMYFLYAKIQPYLHEFRLQMSLPEWMRSIETLVQGSPEGRERVTGMRKNMDSPEPPRLDLETKPSPSV
jgi:hypothetical protein